MGSRVTALIVGKSLGGSSPLGAPPPQLKMTFHTTPQYMEVDIDISANAVGCGARAATLGRLFLSRLCVSSLVSVSCQGRSGTHMQARR